MTRAEAINKIRQMSLPEETMEILQALAPELKESEDERIRKDIINLIYWLKSNPSLCSQYYKDRYDSMLTYLEKQKEQKPTIWTEKDEKNLCDLITYGELPLNLRHWVAGLPEKIKELPQKPAEWSEEDEENMQAIIDTIKRHWLTLPGNTLISWLKSRRPQSHWKPSEMQIEALKSLMICADVRCATKMLCEELLNDLKKLM